MHKKIRKLLKKKNKIDIPSNPNKKFRFKKVYPNENDVTL
jgi:hypothetical protein